ncbi:Similar to GRAMD1B: Protein Aster-B (Homo sapiens) [Cotesia congregata]|uniref:Similar to GRAMD1B: Protein Aster-B (Homo sapiens) n=1 Tax=Cotesia congregata TaxID=51543 RepID=A0A8J2MST1_COTCN|nr:Similar to GRAMD1B: Protein Aster-B (Homo sapiens) [Cotesia congregata]
MYYEKETLHDHPISNMNKSVENLLLSSHDVLSSINSSSLGALNPNKSGNEYSGEELNDSTSSKNDNERNRPLSPNSSPQSSPKIHNRKEYWKTSGSSASNLSLKEHDNWSKADDQSLEPANRSSDSTEAGRSTTEIRKEGRTDRSKKKSSWYNVLYPTYKSRSEDFKRIFKDVPDDERLVVDYSCALQREILVHGRLYVSQNYVCFYANIFMWETLVSLRWKDVESITKEKTALVIPNAISICTSKDKFFLTTFGARDKTYLITAEMWSLVHACYGEELGLTSDDEDYIPPIAAAEEEKLPSRLSTESFSEAEAAPADNVQSRVDPIPETIDKIDSKPDVNLDPTDMSDTTESEAEKQALRLGIRSTTVCTAAHDGRQLSNAVLPIHIDQLFTLLFTSSKFFLDFHTARKTTDLIQSAWTQDPETGQKMRTVSLTVSLTQPVGPRTSQVTETQIMLPCSRPGHRYSINVESSNAGIPYADSFSVITHFCMVAVTENETSLNISSVIKFKKHVWSVMKSLIEKNAWAGMEEYYGSLTKALSVECEDTASGNGIKRKARRRRRAVGVSPSLPVHAPDLPTTLSAAVADPPHVISSASKTREDPTNLMNWILLIAVFCLMIINGLLYYKLWGLEDAAAYTVMDLHVLRSTPKSEEDWINLLQQQESLHNVEMRKWQRVLHTAAQLLRQTEDSLIELQKSMHPTSTEKVFSVLKPNLKGFYNDRDDQRHNEDM